MVPEVGETPVMGIVRKEQSNAGAVVTPGSVEAGVGVGERLL